MVKHIQVHVNDSDYDMLIKAKGKKSWQDFIMQLIPNKEEQPNGPTTTN